MQDLFELMYSYYFNILVIAIGNKNNTRKEEYHYRDIIILFNKEASGIRISVRRMDTC